MPLYITLSAVLVTTLSCWRVDWNTYILCFSHGCYRTFSTGTFFFTNFEEDGGGGSVSNVLQSLISVIPSMLLALI